MEKTPITTALSLVEEFNKLGPAGAVRLLTAAMRQPILKPSMDDYIAVIKEYTEDKKAICTGCVAANMLMKLTGAPYPKIDHLNVNNKSVPSFSFRLSCYLNHEIDYWANGLKESDYDAIGDIEVSLNRLRLGEIFGANYYLREHTNWKFPDPLIELPVIRDDYNESDLQRYDEYATYIETLSTSALN